jgi:ubiquinone/menaquinone biosynthesis C-methylase UbiE
MSGTSAQGWDAEIGREKQARKYPKWPNEAMLKVLFGGGDYLETPRKPQPNWRVLDVGCGFANNLVPFADMGCESHGVDLTEDMVATAQEVMDERGYKTTIAVGHNRALPYPDNHFDLLLSVNTLHYEGNAENIVAAFAEFCRVLKPGGVVYISTVGPEHTVRQRAESLGDGRYRVANFDFRDGEIMSFFDNGNTLAAMVERFFTKVETARVTERLMKLPLDFLIAVGSKRFD